MIYERERKTRDTRAVVRFFISNTRGALNYVMIQNIGY